MLAQGTVGKWVFSVQPDLHGANTAQVSALTICVRYCDRHVSALPAQQQRSHLSFEGGSQPG